MCRYFTRTTKLFGYGLLLFSVKSHAEVRVPVEKFRPQLSGAEDFSEQTPSDSVEENSRRMAARDSDNAVDRAFGKLDKKRQKEQRYKYWYLLPLGIPQYAEGYRVMGTSMALGQVTSLALYYDRLKKADSADQAASSVTAGQTPAQAASNPFVVNYLNQNEKNVKEARKEAQYFLFAFIALYGFSTYEALYDPFDFRKVDALRQKKKAKDRDRDEEPNYRDESGSKDDEARIDPPSRDRSSSFGLMVVPMDDKKYQVALSWQAIIP